MYPAEPRPHYVPSGRFPAQKLTIAALLLVALSAVIAVGYTIQLSLSYHFMVLSAIFPIFALAWGLHKAVHSAHLRSPLLAAALGVCCGLSAYLGYFHLDHCLRWRASPLAIGKLPAYIAFRMETDQWNWQAKGAWLVPAQPAPGIVPQRPLAAARILPLNWGVFGIESLLLAGVAAGTAWAAAWRPYSESRGTWLDLAQLSLAPEDAKSLEQALRERAIADWVAADPRLVPEHEPHTYLYLWYVPGQADQDIDLDAFLALGDGPRLLLEPDEIAALVPLFPGLQEIAASQEDVASEADATNDPASARIWKVPPPYAGPVDNPQCRWRWKAIMQLAQLAPLAVVPAFMAAVIGLAYFLTEVMGWLPEWLVVVAVIGSALPCLVLVRYWYDPHGSLATKLGKRYHRKLLLDAIASRPDALIAAGHPSAFTAEMCPRRLWLAGENSPYGASNIGLMLVDRDRRAILFEGDYERYWIGAESILDARIERVPIGPPTTASYYGVVLQVRLGSRVWEMPFFPLDDVPGSTRWDQAMLLLGHVEDLCQRSFAEEQSAPPEPAPAGAHAV